MPIKDLYSSIENRLLSEVPEILHIDVFNGQYRALERGETHPFNFPACLVAITDMRRIIDDPAKAAETEVRLYIGQEVYTDSHNDSPQKSDSLARYDLLDKITEVLEEFRGTCHAPLQVSDIALDDSYNNLQVNVITLKTVYFPGRV